jgi:radical SAM superfamily enzyme YgiQ (UPF0313 family)
MGLLVLGTVLRLQGWEPVLVDCLDPDHPGMVPVKVKAHADGHFARTPIPRPDALKGVSRTYSRYGIDPELMEKDLLCMDPPAAILVTSMMTYWYTGVDETVMLLKDHFPGVPVLLGGVYASLLPVHARERIAADEVIVGPGESALTGALQKHTGLAPDSEGARRDLEFRAALDLMRRVRFLPLLTSRGCPFRCTYCASGKLVPRFVRRPVLEVVAEIESARVRYQIIDIALYDDAFLVDSANHAIPILEAVAERLPGMRWHTPNGLHVSAIDPRVASAMKRAGFETIRLGLESSSDRFHAKTGGKTDAGSFAAAVRTLRAAGFSGRQIGVYLLVGLPGQSRTQIDDDVDMCLRLGAAPKLAEYSPIPGTSMWSTARYVSRYPIADEPLFHNCTLLPAAEPDVDWAFIQKTRRRIREFLGSGS